MSAKSKFTVTYTPHPDRSALVCTLDGRLLGTPDCYAFLTEARDRTEAGVRHLILDCAGVDRINSTGVGILAALYTSVSRRDGQVVLVNLADHLRDILEVMRLFEFLREEETVVAALGTLAGQEG